MVTIKQMIKRYIAPTLICGALAVFASGCSNKPLPEDKVIHKEHQKAHIYLQDGVFADKCYFDDEDYIVVVGNLENKIPFQHEDNYRSCVLYVSKDAYASLNVGDRMPQNLDYRTKDVDARVRAKDLEQKINHLKAEGGSE